jgi:hypothetical protein
MATAVCVSLPSFLNINELNIEYLLSFLSNLVLSPNKTVLINWLYNNLNNLNDMYYVNELLTFDLNTLNNQTTKANYYYAVKIGDIEYLTKYRNSINLKKNVLNMIRGEKN